MLRVRDLVPGETHALIVERFADEVAAGGRDVRVFFAEDLDGRVGWGKAWIGGKEEGRTMTSSPLMSRALSRLSSPPAPSVLECMSVAK